MHTPTDNRLKGPPHNKTSPERRHNTTCGAAACARALLCLGLDLPALAVRNRTGVRQDAPATHASRQAAQAGNAEAPSKGGRAN